MKVLLFGDASNYHRALAEGLRELGHEVTVASDGSGWMNTERDIDISRTKGSILSGGLLWLKLQSLMMSRLRGYDIVHISNPIFVSQRPSRNAILFNQLKRYNGRIFLTALGTDTPYIEMCVDPNSPCKYNEWMVNGSPTSYNINKNDILQAWLKDPLKSHCEKIYSNVDGAVSVLYEYDIACRRKLPDSKVAYAGIPIDTASIRKIDLPDNIKKVKLFLGMHRDRKLEKGTDRILVAAKRVVEKHSDKCTLDIVENIPYKEYLERLQHSHVVLDQLYSYTPATNALLAMAMGLNTVSGGEEEFYRFIQEDTLRPVINAVPDDDALVRTLEEVVTHHELIKPRGAAGREFVEKHNDKMIVAKRFVDFWQRGVGEV